MHLCQKLQRLFNQHKFLFLTVLLGAGVNLTTNLKMKQKAMNSLGPSLRAPPPFLFFDKCYS